MPTKGQLETALVNADAAGDVEAARQLANALKAGDYSDSVGNKLKGAADAGLSVASSVVAEPLSGLAGVGGLLNPFDDVTRENVGDHVDLAREMFTYDPQTEEGRGQLKALANALKPVAEIIEKAEKFSGDIGYDLAGPIGGAIGKSLPTAIGLAVGGVTAKSGAKGLGRVGEAASVAAQPIKQNVRQIGKELAEQGRMSAQGAREIGQDIITAPTQPFRQKQKAALIEGEGSVEGAGYRLDDKGRVRSNPAEKSAESMGWPKDDIGMIKVSSTIDRQKALDMLDIYERGTKNKRYRLTHAPGDVVGNSYLERLNHIRAINKQAGKDIDVQARSLKTSPVDIRDAYRSFAEGLKDLGVTLRESNGRYVADFSKSNIEGVAGAERLVNQMLKRLQRPTAVTGYNVHQLKRFIDNQVTYGKMQRDLSGDVESLVKGFRHDIDRALDNTFDAYNQANIRYADTIDILDAAQSRIGKKVDLTHERASTMLGQEARKLMSNYKVRGEMLAELDELESVYRKYGGRATDDLIFQTAFVNTLENTLGAYRPGTFQGVQESAVRNAARGNVRGGVVDIAADLAVEGVKKIKGVTPEKQIQSMRELLKQQGRSNSKEVTIRDN